MLAALGVNTASLQTVAEAPSWYHPGQSGALCQGRKVLAVFGAIHPATLAASDLHGPASGFEVVLEDVALPKKGPARPLRNCRRSSRFSAILLYIDEDVTAEALLRDPVPANRFLPMQPCLMFMPARGLTPAASRSLLR